MRTGKPASWSPLANGPLMARTVSDDPRLVRPGLTKSLLTCASSVERVTGIEPALSAWEADVLPLNYTRAHEHGLVTLGTGRACTVSAQTWYRNR